MVSTSIMPGSLQGLHQPWKNMLLNLHQETAKVLIWQFSFPSIIVNIYSYQTRSAIPKIILHSYYPKLSIYIYIDCMVCVAIAHLN